MYSYVLFGKPDRPVLSPLIILRLPVFSPFSCSVFSPKTAANMWFHLSSGEIRPKKKKKNRLMVISLSPYLLPSSPLFSLVLPPPHRGRAWWKDLCCIFCFSFKFRCPRKKLQMWAARHTYTKMLRWKKTTPTRTDKERIKKIFL